MRRVCGWVVLDGYRGRVFDELRRVLHWFLPELVGIFDMYRMRSRKLFYGNRGTFMHSLQHRVLPSNLSGHIFMELRELFRWPVLIYRRFVKLQQLPCRLICCIVCFMHSLRRWVFSTLGWASFV